MRWSFSELQLDGWQPWVWPRHFQNALWVGSAVLGLLLLSPWWRHSWQAWDDAHEAKATLMAQQEATQALHAQTKQLLQNQLQTRFADVVVLGQLAQQHGLQFSQVGFDQPQHSPAMTALHMQQLPIHLKVQGAWDSWLHWLAQWTAAAPGVTVSSLDIQADPQGGISAHLLVAVPQSTAAESASELLRVNLDGAAWIDPFNAQTWIHAQRTHAKQHPSYARWVAPELLRPRDWLESFPRERLQYVGQIASTGKVEALVKILPLAGTHKDTSMMDVFRVRVGQHLGQNFGKVLVIASNELVVQELVPSHSGEWQPREVRLPLHEVAP